MVTVWHVPLARASIELPDRLAGLSRDERTRALRLRDAADRATFVMVRSVLRSLLGELLQRPASDVRFRQTGTGKPILADESPVRFSVAHSDAFACIAIDDHGCDVGVDIESWKHISIPEMESVLTPSERTSVLAARDRYKAFYDLWTRKEALLKASGAGLGGLSSEFNTPLDTPGWFGRFYVHRMPAAPGYSAALALDCGATQRRPQVLHRMRSA